MAAAVRIKRRDDRTPDIVNVRYGGCRIRRRTPLLRSRDWEAATRGSTFVPLPVCKIVDTGIAGGNVPAGGYRDFHARGTVADLYWSLHVVC